MKEKKFWTFCEKELQKTNQKDFQIEKVTKQKYIWNGRIMITCLIAEYIKIIQN